VPAAEHLRLLAARAGVLLDLVPPGSAYPRSLAAVTGLAVGRLEAENPAAAELANVCAFLAPEPVPGDEITQEAATYLAGALRDMGRYAEALDLDQDILDRRRRVLGEDHSETLHSARNLADLRALGEADGS
jgi:hypothetical protein